MICKDCGGSGKVFPDRRNKLRVDCSTCSGSGQVLPVCTKCGGSGEEYKIGEKRAGSCSHCGGSGDEP